MRHEFLSLVDRLYDEKKIVSPILDVGSAETVYQKAQGYDFRQKFNGLGMVYEAADIRKDVGIDHVGDFGVLDLGKKFNTIFCMGMLEHCENPNAVVENCYKHLEKDGHILVTVPDIWRVHAPHDYWRFTESGLKVLCKKFEQIEFGSFGVEKDSKGVEHYFVGKK